MDRRAQLVNLIQSLHRVSRPLRMILATLLASMALLLLLGGISAAAPADLPQTIVFNQDIAAIISQVTTPTLEYELAGLTGERPVIVAGSLRGLPVSGRRLLPSSPSGALGQAVSRLWLCGQDR